MEVVLNTSPKTVPIQRRGWQHRKVTIILVNEISQERFKNKAMKIIMGKSEIRGYIYMAISIPHSLRQITCSINKVTVKNTRAR